MLVGSAIGGAEPAVAGAIRNAAARPARISSICWRPPRSKSGLNPKASAKTSSAQGSVSVHRQTWLSTLKQAGPGARLRQICRRHHAGRQRPVCRSPIRRCAQKIFALRDDPAANAAMAGAFTRANAAQLADKLGRKRERRRTLHGAFSRRQRRVETDQARGRATRTRPPPTRFRAPRTPTARFSTTRRAMRVRPSDVYATLAGPLRHGARRSRQCLAHR